MEVFGLAHRSSKRQYHVQGWSRHPKTTTQRYSWSLKCSSQIDLDRQFKPLNMHTHIWLRKSLDFGLYAQLTSSCHDTTFASIFTRLFWAIRIRPGATLKKLLYWNTSLLTICKANFSDDLNGLYSHLSLCQCALSILHIQRCIYNTPRSSILRLNRC